MRFPIQVNKFCSNSTSRVNRQPDTGSCSASLQTASSEGIRRGLLESASPRAKVSKDVIDEISTRSCSRGLTTANSSWRSFGQPGRPHEEFSGGRTSVSQRRAGHSVKYGPSQHTFALGHREILGAPSHSGDETVVIHPQYLHSHTPAPAWRTDRRRHTWAPCRPGQQIVCHARHEGWGKQAGCPFQTTLWRA